MKIFYHIDVATRVKEVAKVNGWMQVNDLNATGGEGFLLSLEDGRLAISDLSEKSWKPLCIDFLDPQFLLRLKKVEHETQLIKRAIGHKPQEDIGIWDATAGLGRDAMVLAKLGYRVTTVERSPVLHELLFDAFERARESEDLKESISRLKLLSGDSKQLLADLDENLRPDIIYLDPMYPEAKKSAQPKKEMQLLRKLLGPDNNLSELLQVSRSIAKKKVIVKNSPFADLKLVPKYSLNSKSVRLDVY